MSPEKPIELAAEIRHFRALVREAVKTGNVKKSRFANIDETAVQVFALMVRTLHWRGAKSVGGTKLDSCKLSLSIQWYVRFMLR